MRGSLRAVASLVAAASFILIGASTAGAGGGIPSLTVDVDPTSGPPGTPIEVTGECFENQVGGSCDDVEVLLLDPNGVEVDSAVADREGAAYGALVNVPIAGLCGDYTIVVNGIENDEIIISDEIPFVVTGGDCPTPPTEPPVTPATLASTSTTGAVAAAAARPRFTG